MSADRDRVTAILAQEAFLTSEEKWLADTLLEALDTIDRLEGEKEALVRELYIETGIWRGQALNEGNE